MAEDSPYYPRALTPVIREALADTPVVCLVGPRQSDKTTLVQRIAPEFAYVSLDEYNYHQAASLDPTGFVDSLPAAAASTKSSERRRCSPPSRSPWTEIAAPGAFC